jgi:hypothetical protein
MELQTERQRRPRTRAQKTTGVVAKTINDARGIAEPLERYCELLACQIVALYNAIHGLPMPLSRINFSGLLAPGFVAGQDGKADQVLREARVEPTFRPVQAGG